MRDHGDDDDESPPEDEPGDDEEAKRHDVAKMVAQLRDSVDVELEAPDEPALANGDDDEARRQEVARMVTEMRDGLAANEPEETPSAAGDEAKREDVASMVARMRAELDSDTTPEDESEADAPDADVRDEVRRAVEAARAEMAAGQKDAIEESDEGVEPEKKFSFPDWQAAHMEPSGPPVIVIKDPEGRVELARVYETLSKVDCDENAALLNYTPHSVTVGLNARASVPEVAALSQAIQAVFGRDCKVDSDGVRVNVQIGKDLKGKDSAA